MPIDAYLILITIAAFAIFAFYVFIDYAKRDINKFLDRWANKTRYFWLPFYSLQRLIREVILKKK